MINIVENVLQMMSSTVKCPVCNELTQANCRKYCNRCIDTLNQIAKPIVPVDKFGACWVCRWRPASVMGFCVSCYESSEQHWPLSSGTELAVTVNIISNYINIRYGEKPHFADALKMLEELPTTPTDTRFASFEYNLIHVFEVGVGKFAFVSVTGPPTNIKLVLRIRE